jgi:hypothetical protein
MAGRVLRRWFGRRRGIRIIRLNNKALCSGDTIGHQPRSRSNRWRLVRDASPAAERQRGQFLGAVRGEFPRTSAWRDVSFQTSRAAQRNCWWGDTQKHENAATQQRAT